MRSLSTRWTCWVFAFFLSGESDFGNDSIKYDRRGEENKSNSQRCQPSNEFSIEFPFKTTPQFRRLHWNKAEWLRAIVSMDYDKKQANQPFIPRIMKLAAHVECDTNEMGLWRVKQKSIPKWFSIRRRIWFFRTVIVWTHLKWRKVAERIRNQI